MVLTDERITMLNPNTGREDTRIRVAMYEPVRAAILEALGERGEIAFKDLRAEVEARTPAALWEDASPGWYTTTVKLDLEARGSIERVPGVRPQTIRVVTGNS